MWIEAEGREGDSGYGVVKSYNFSGKWPGNMSQGPSKCLHSLAKEFHIQVTVLWKGSQMQMVLLFYTYVHCSMIYTDKKLGKI